ncbi:amidohydrolase, partial [Erwinia amylovora]
MSTLKLRVLQQPLVWMDGAANLRFFDQLRQEIPRRDMILLPEG